MKWNWLFLSQILISAIAQAENGPAMPAGIQGVTPFIPLIIIFGIFYFLIIRPQQKRAKLQQQFLAELKRGDMVITNAGIVGMVKVLSEKIITLEVDEGVCLKILRSQILEAANNLNKDAKPA